MWATASAAPRLHRSAPSSAVAPFTGVTAVVLAPAADMATVAAVPSTNERREISRGSDMIASQRLTHTMHGAAAVADHRDVRIVDGETFGAAGGDEILA